MNNTSLIPTNFNIPKRYDQIYQMQLGSCRMVIRRGGRRLICYEVSGRIANKVEQSVALDWCQEVIEKIRADCSL